MIRWLVVGAGAAGQCHMAAIAAEPLAGLAGVVSLAPPPPGVETVYSGFGEAVAGTSPDAVILATPHNTHLPLALEALALGLPVLCEKPVGRHSDEARQVLEAARSAGVPVGVVLNQRSVVHHRWIRDLIASGQLTPGAVTFSGTLARLSGWHADAEQAGGGALRVIGLHYLDLMRWWLGEPQTLATLTSGGASEDAVNVTMGFAGDVTGNLALTAQADRSAGPVTCVIEAPAARIMLSGHLIIRVDGLPDPPTSEPHDRNLIFGPGHQAVISEASAALLEARELPVTLADALPSLVLVDRAYACANLAAGPEASLVKPSKG